MILTNSAKKTGLVRNASVMANKYIQLSLYQY